MPTFRVTSPDGAVYKVNAPEGATEQDALAYVQANQASLPKEIAPASTPKNGSELSSLPPKAKPEPGFFEKGGAVNKFAEGVMSGDVQRGFRQGAGQALLGAAQLGAEGTLPIALLRQAIGAGQNPVGQQIGQYAAGRQQEFDASKAGKGSAGQFGEMVGETLPAMVVPGNALRLGGRLIQAAIGGGAVGATQPVTQPGNFASQKAAQAGIGAGIGLAGQGIVGEPLRAVAGRGAALIAGGAPNISSEAAQAMSFAKQRNLPIYADDVMASPTARAGGRFIDEVPFVGGAGVRKAQSEAAGREAQGLVSRFQTGDASPNEALRASADAQLKRARGIKNKLYEEAFSELNQGGGLTLPKTRINAMRFIQAEQAKGSLADQGLVRELQKYVGSPSFNFEGWHSVRSELGQLINSKHTGENAVLSDRATSVLQQLKKSMDSELSFAASVMRGSDAWKRADNFYRTVMPKYKRGVVASMLRSPDPDAIANRILGGRDSEGIARQVYSALDKDGRGEVRGALLSQALERSMKQSDGGDLVFSPGQFANELKKVEDRTRVFFSKQDRTEIEGLRNYLSFVRNSGQYAANPPTGKRVTPHLLLMMAGTGAGSISSGAGAAIGGLSTYGGVATAARALLRTKAGRNLLLRLGSQSPGSNAAKNTAQLINSFMQRELSASSAKDERR